MLFLSYVRADAGRTGCIDRLWSNLVEVVGEDHVFLDVHTINAGSSWSEAIDAAIRRATAVILVFGDEVVSTSLPRLCEPDSVVRNEVELARQLGRPILPIVIGAGPPSAEQLPADLGFLLDLHWSTMDAEPQPADFRRFQRDISRVVAQHVVGELVRLEHDRFAKCYHALLDVHAPVRKFLASNLLDLSMPAHQLVEVGVAAELTGEACAGLGELGHALAANLTPAALRDVQGLNPMAAPEQALQDRRRLLRLAAAAAAPGDRVTSHLVDIMLIAIDRARERRYAQRHQTSARLATARSIVDTWPEDQQQTARRLRGHLVRDVALVDRSYVEHLIRLESW